MEVDDDKSLEEMCHVASVVSESSGWHEPLRVMYICDKTCNEEGFKFYNIAPILVEDKG